MVDARRGGGAVLGRDEVLISLNHGVRAIAAKFNSDIIPGFAELFTIKNGGVLVRREYMFRSGRASTA